MRVTGAAVCRERQTIEAVVNKTLVEGHELREGTVGERTETGTFVPSRPDRSARPARPACPAWTRGNTARPRGLAGMSREHSGAPGHGLLGRHVRLGRRVRLVRHVPHSQYYCGRRRRSRVTRRASTVVAHCASTLTPS